MCGASVHDATHDTAHDTSVISKQNLLLEFCAEPKSRDEMQTYIDVSRQTQKQKPEIHYCSFQITKKQDIRIYPYRPASYLFLNYISSSSKGIESHPFIGIKIAFERFYCLFLQFFCKIFN